MGKNYQLPITNYQLPITNYQLPITNYQLPITNYQLPITNYPLPITNYVYLVNFVRGNSICSLPVGFSAHWLYSSEAIKRH
ncbi:hypothetical protein CBP13_15865 [Fischerella thermalis WC441]|nr:hypothetical protein CBP25_12775 [Fischerella thermalis WC527]PLZ50214.1 hypothetical protein CBP13_15865 [Fischerella thermalis WC441]